MLVGLRAELSSVWLIFIMSFVASLHFVMMLPCCFSASVKVCFEYTLFWVEGWWVELSCIDERLEFKHYWTVPGNMFHLSLFFIMIHQRPLVIPQHLTRLPLFSCWCCLLFWLTCCCCGRFQLSSPCLSDSSCLRFLLPLRKPGNQIPKPWMALLSVVENHDTQMISSII